MTDAEWEELQAVHAAAAVEIAAAAVAEMRRKRTDLLKACDWTQIADAPLTTEQRDAWAAYRQALRDLPQNHPDPATVVWPVEPEA
jgi:hypothetical protein